MKRSTLLGVTLWAFLFAASPALATITVVLENPGTGQEVSGVTAITGYAFAPGKTVTVKLRANGVTGDVISCCVPRADVRAARPEAPLNTGFSALTNYGLQSLAMPLTIGVEVSAPDEMTVIVDHAVTLVKPGGRSTDSPQTLFSFLNDLNPTGARLALAGRDIFVTPVTVIDSGAGGTRQSTLVLRWFQNSQSFGVVSAASDTSFTNVQSIFTSRCVSCHSGPTPPEGLNLSAGSAFANLVPIVSTEDASRY